MAMAVDIESPRRALDPIDDCDDNDDGGGIGRAGTPTPRVRIRSANNRPRSYHQILEDFQSSGSPPVVVESPESPIDEDVIRVREDRLTGGSPPPSRRKEDTARRHKRFSLPAIALQTTAVTTRPNATGEGQGKRFSLVLGGKLPRGDVPDGSGDDLGKDELRNGVAVGKLTELLERERG